MSNLLGASQIRALADQLNIKPSKKLGQNFVVDAERL
jgi:16S rRNA (adenine1518-N6/adenine1519-N6)-dimethyltransferase